RLGHGAPSGSSPAYRGCTGCSPRPPVWNHGSVTPDAMRSLAAALSPAQRQRAVGPVVAAAAGDALGAPYEFQPPVPAPEDIDMIGGGVLDWQPGEGTDDPAMAVAELQATLAPADGPDLRVATARAPTGRHR